jgi:hypothetical protein
MLFFGFSFSYNQFPNEGHSERCGQAGGFTMKYVIQNSQFTIILSPEPNICASCSSKRNSSEKNWWEKSFILNHP